MPAPPMPFNSPFQVLVMKTTPLKGLPMYRPTPKKDPSSPEVLSARAVRSAETSKFMGRILARSRRMATVPEEAAATWPSLKPLRVPLSTKSAMFGCWPPPAHWIEFGSSASSTTLSLQFVHWLPEWQSSVELAFAQWPGRQVSPGPEVERKRVP